MQSALEAAPSHQADGKFGGLQYPCPREGRQGLCHADLLQDGRGIA